MFQIFDNNVHAWKNHQHCTTYRLECLCYTQHINQVSDCSGILVFFGVATAFSRIW